ncbi:hypothetical protein CJ030_MR4G016285 [Morella rubra]|uniref:Transmembrane protein n=1 Tax=Morella rubra TaxID=262757 RepID=A0A6A1VX10_9ROSI|nr:hypothetical protein CJ030_MR4G016285 [Morella rubra]
MEIPEKLLKYKFYILFVLTLSLTLVSLVFLAPSFLSILAYFWPLLVSTALFLFAVIAFGKISVPGADTHGDTKAGEGILDYVAGRPDHPVESFKSEE